MERTLKWGRRAILFLAIFHLIGLVGLHLDIRPEILDGDSVRELFQSLVPFNLLLTTALLLSFHREWTVRFGLYIFGVFWVGYLVELIGVRTGAIFGNYSYGETLGFTVAGIPPVIGINWVLLIYISSYIAQHITPKLWIGSAIGAVLMVLLDILIEPMAIRYDFWTWEGGTPPLLNYFGWFIIAYLLHIGYYFLEEKPENPIAKGVYVIQFLFFAMFWVISLGN